MRLADLATPNPLTVTPRTSVATALRLLRENAIGRLPVVERSALRGVVRREGLLRLTPSEATTLSRFEIPDLLARLTVERAVEPALALDATTPLAEVARRVADGAPECLVLEGDRLVGILTRSDLLRALTSEGAIATLGA